MKDLPVEIKSKVSYKRFLIVEILLGNYDTLKVFNNKLCYDLYQDPKKREV